MLNFEEIWFQGRDLFESVGHSGPRHWLTRKGGLETRVEVRQMSKLKLCYLFSFETGIVDRVASQLSASNSQKLQYQALV